MMGVTRREEDKGPEKRPLVLMMARLVRRWTYEER
jgi:hypothetical protein